MPNSTKGKAAWRVERHPRPQNRPQPELQPEEQTVERWGTCEAFVAVAMLAFAAAITNFHSVSLWPAFHEQLFLASCMMSDTVFQDVNPVTRIWNSSNKTKIVRALHAYALHTVACLASGL